MILILKLRYMRVVIGLCLSIYHILFQFIIIQGVSVKVFYLLPLLDST